MRDFTIRESTAADESFLREMQYEAQFVPPGHEPFPPEIVDEPGVARYSTSADPSYGYVDDETPELGIAVLVSERGHGVGTTLLRMLLAELDRCCLSVSPHNAAIRLYENCGFVETSRNDDAVMMLYDTR
jgi:GNAT superfamily N-acetyltransferase